MPRHNKEKKAAINKQQAEPPETAGEGADSPAADSGIEPVRGRVRARDLGLIVGRYPPGPCNAITDVEDVLVGHSTILDGYGRLRVGKGPVRTGVTAIIPNGKEVFLEQVVGGGFILNGAGEVSGLTQVMEWGLIETPILLTNTLSVGACSEAVVKFMVEKHPGIGREDDVVIPLVGECDDSWLNDIAGRHVRDEHVYEAIENAASGPVAEGNVGGGTGMITCDFKGGIGTSSRKLSRVEGGYTIGMLVMSNFGRLRDLRMNGIPVGELLVRWYADRPVRRQSYGSIIAVLATDAPLSAHQLNRLSKRVALGLGRVGSYAAYQSGEIVVAFSTANKIPRTLRKRIHRMKMLSDHYMDPLYIAAIEATEEAIYNALCLAEEMEGINRRIVPALPLDKIAELLSLYQVPPSPELMPLALRRKKPFAGPRQQVGAILKSWPKPPKSSRKKGKRPRRVK